jgi:hypothetical protein
LWTVCWKNIYLMWIHHTRTVFINLRTTVMHYSSSNCVLIMGPITSGRQHYVSTDSDEESGDEEANE